MSHELYGFPRWIGGWRSDIPYRHRVFSLRWLPRWLSAWAVLWNHEGSPDRSWERKAVEIGRRPLKTLDPWVSGL